jgi:hypothetical protein
LQNARGVRDLRPRSLEKSGESMSNEPFDPSKQFFPLGYFVRIGVLFALLIGGVVCVIFYNQLVGAALLICVPLFQRFSGLREMHKKHKAEMEAYEARSRERNP